MSDKKRKFIVWVNFVRDEYAVHHQIHPRSANANIGQLLLSPIHRKNLQEQFDAGLSSEEAAKTLPEPQA